MHTGLDIADSFLFPLFGEIFVVKEKDFSIQYHPMGEGKQKLLMLVNSKTAEFLENEEHLLLKTIVEKGLRKQMEDVWVVNLNNFPQQKLESLFNHFEPTQMIVWGLDSWMGSQGLNLGVHRQGLLLGVEILQALPLNQYIAEPAQKPKLWSAMQKMFFN